MITPLGRAGIVLGIGMGGFFDGIVLHQILGWHHMICVAAHCQAETVNQLRIQNTQDGFFHLAVWLLTISGIVMLFRAGNTTSIWQGRVLAGSMIAGWGLFNFVEGIIDHQILGIHHVLPGHPSQFLFDMLFLASGALMLLVGLATLRAVKAR